MEAARVLIEDSASGQSLVHELKAAARLPVLPMKADSDKVVRPQAVTHLGGKSVPAGGAVWLDDYIDELSPPLPTAPTTIASTALPLR